MTNQNQQQDGQNDNDNVNDPTNGGGAESLKGKKDEQGIPLDAEERAEHYKKLAADNDTKFKNSSQGVEGLLNKNKNLQEENENLKNPSLSPHMEGSVSRKEFNDLQRTITNVANSQATIEDRQKFERELANLFSDEEFEIIKTHRDEFKEYAYREENQSTPLPVLARSFMVEQGLLKPQKEKEEEGKKKGIEEGTGGSNFVPKKKGYTQKQAETMRTEDPKKYNRLVSEGKLTIID